MVVIVLPLRNKNNLIQFPGRKKRKYEVIWELIKKKKKCILEVHPAMVARVHKAVTKEKYNDILFKAEHEDDFYFIKMVKTKVSSSIVRLEFKLKARIGEL